MVSPALPLSGSPQDFPFAYDPLNDAVQFVPVSAAELDQASFLDQRYLPGKSGPWLRFADVEAALRTLGPASPPAYIFHIGHVGSTLLSRLLAAQPQAMPVREPLVLRSLALTHADLGTPESLVSEAVFTTQVAVFSRLLSRTWTSDQTAVIKATSFASVLAQVLLAPPAVRALFMSVPAEAYLASILGAPNSPAEIRAMAQSRLRRLNRLSGEPVARLWELSIGELTAMSWACETATLAAAAASSPARVRWIDFDRFLADPEAGLDGAFAHLGIAVGADEIGRIVSSPIFSRYSKAPEHAYDRALRHEVLADGRARHGDEIRRGLKWLEQAAAASPPVARAVDRAGLVQASA